MWQFIQNQILGMKWLKDLVYRICEQLFGTTASGVGAYVAFFIYDMIKIFTLLCVLVYVISFIQSYFPPDRTKRLLGPLGGLKGRIAAALLGTLTPFCSCSSIPIFMGFVSAELPLGMCFSFLISSPMVDLGSLVLLTSVFGPSIAILYVILGLVIAVAGGSIIQTLQMEDQVADFIKLTDQQKSLRTLKMDLSDRLVYAWTQLAATISLVGVYILLGVAIGALIHNQVPAALVVKLLGKDSPFAVVLAALLGIPMYADIFGTIPVAEALLAKGAMTGVLLSFMMAVTTLSLPSVIMLSKVVKRKLLAVFIAICTLGILCTGYLFNFLQPLLYSL